MEYLYADVYGMKTDLKYILNNSTSIAGNTENIASSLNNLETIMKSGFKGVQSDLQDISYQFNDIIDIMIDFSNIQFIQNEKRNELLASIDATLKAPNKTAAFEKYEISLELTQRNKNETAIKFLKEAIELNPLHFRSYIQITLNLFIMKNYEEALHYAKESLNFAPDNDEILGYTYYLVARAYEKNKDFQGALENINRSFNLHSQSNYIYERSRYYALLKDVNNSMPELKKSVEMDSMYFAISLVDSAFHPYAKEREKLLMSLKQEIELKLNNAIAQMEALKLHQYDTSRLSDCDLIYNGYRDIILNHKFNMAQPNFDLLNYLSIKGVEEKSIRYSYNSLMEEFNEHYTKLNTLHRNKLPLIKELKSSNTYVHYNKSYIEFVSYLKEFNHLVVNLKRMVNEFKGISTTAQQTFKENLEFTLELCEVQRKKLKSEKRKKVYNLLGVVGAIILPSEKQHDHNRESRLEVAYEKVKNVAEEEQSNIENEGKHSLAIQRFADEVLIYKPLPNTLALG